MFAIKKIKSFLFITFVFLCFATTAYAKYQIQFDDEANRVMYMGGDTLRGNFDTKDECLSYQRSRTAFEQNHSECVGSDEQTSSQNNYSQPQQYDDTNYKKMQQEAKYQEMLQQQRLEEHEMLKQQKLKEMKMQALFDQGKKEMLVQLKGSSNSGGLKLKSGKKKLTLKSGIVPVDNCDSARKVELQQAQRRLTGLRVEVKTMQVALERYKNGLLKNVSNLDQQSIEIEKMSDKILSDGIEYISGTVTGKFLKSKFKFMSKGQKKKYDDFMKLVEKYKDAKEKKDLLFKMATSPNDIKKLVMGADMLAENVIPGWSHIKINFKAWSTVGKECAAWLNLNDTNRETQEYSLAIKAIALRMKSTVEDIDRLKRNMVKLTDACI